MKKGVTLLVDGHEPEMVRRVLMTELRQTLERHDLGQKIFRAIGGVAPAMGMISTLIGLVGYEYYCSGIQSRPSPSHPLG